MSAIMQPRLVPLKEWAKLVFGDFAPHPNTLLKWVSNGRIYPMPKKVGKGWFVEPKAEYKGD